MLLNYKAFGQKNLPAVVLLHGLFGMSDNLSSIAKSLSRHFYVIAPDLINHGKSGHRALMTYPAMANDVMALLSSLEIEQFDLLGHSMGGKVAMQLVDLYPRHIDKLVVADIAPVAYPESHNQIIEQMQSVAHKNLILRKEVDQILAEKVSESTLRQFFMKNMAKDSQGYWRWQFGLDEITAAYVSICKAPLLTRAFSGPVLFIKGEHSDYIQPAYQDVIMTYYPNATFKIIQGAGHWLHAEKPAVFTRIVDRFFNMPC